MAPENRTTAPGGDSHGAAHGHTGPVTSAEQASQAASPEAVPPEDRIRIAEEAARQEDA